MAFTPLYNTKICLIYASVTVTYLKKLLLVVNFCHTKFVSIILGLAYLFHPFFSLGQFFSDNLTLRPQKRCKGVTSKFT